MSKILNRIDFKFLLRQFLSQVLKIFIWNEMVRCTSKQMKLKLHWFKRVIRIWWRSHTTINLFIFLRAIVEFFNIAMSKYLNPMDYIICWRSSRLMRKNDTKSRWVHFILLFIETTDPANNILAQSKEDPTVGYHKPHKSIHPRRKS